jgi:hypothetical protein
MTICQSSLFFVKLLFFDHMIRLTGYAASRSTSIKIPHIRIDSEANDHKRSTPLFQSHVESMSHSVGLQHTSHRVSFAYKCSRL